MKTRSLQIGAQFENVLKRIPFIAPKEQGQNRLAKVKEQPPTQRPLPRAPQSNAMTSAMTSPVNGLTTSAAISPAILQNRPLKVTLMGIDEHYPAAAVHGFTIESQTLHTDRLERSNQRGGSGQASISFPGVMPGLGLLSPMISHEREDECLISQGIEHQAHEIPDLSAASLSLLKPGDSAKISTSQTSNIGLYGSTSHGVPGLTTPHLFASAIVSSVLLPCVVLATAGGSSFSAGEGASIEATKSADQCFTLAAKTLQTRQRDSSIGIKTICWLMWLASAAIDLKSLGQTPKPEQDLTKVKAKPNLWKSLTVALDFNHSVKNTKSRDIHYDFDVEKSTQEHQLARFIHKLGPRPNKYLHEDEIGHSSIAERADSEVKRGVEVRVFDWVETQHAKLTKESAESVGTVEGMLTKTSTRSEEHIRHLKLPFAFETRESAHLTQTEVNLTTAEGPTSNIVTDHVGWHATYSLVLNPNHWNMQRFTADVQFSKALTNFTSAKIPINELQQAVDKEVQAHYQVKLAIDLNAQDLRSSLATYTKLVSEHPDAANKLLNTVSVPFKTEQHSPPLNTLTQRSANQHTSQTLSYLAKVAQQRPQDLMPILVQKFKQPNGQQLVKALAFLIQETTPSVKKAVEKPAMKIELSLSAKN